jgi:hypothetical protein
MKRIRETIWLLLFASTALAGGTTIKQIDTIKNSSGGSALSVPSTGTTFDTDTNSVSLTNKTLSSTTDVIGGVTMTLGSDATGDLYYRNSSGVLTRLPVCTGANVLGASGGLPACVAQAGAGTWAQEDVTGCNGSATGFTLAHTPAASLGVSLYLDGVVLRQGASKDYTISGTSITLGSACQTGQNLYAVYLY